MAKVTVPTALHWIIVDGQSQPLVCTNAESFPVIARVAAAGSQSQGFKWDSGSKTMTAGPPGGSGGQVTFQVTPPPVNPAAPRASATIQVDLLHGASGIFLESRSVALDNAQPLRVAPGELAIARIEPHPGKDDLAGEGEFVELRNTTGRALDLVGSSLFHLGFGIDQKSFDFTGKPRPSSVRLAGFGPQAPDFPGTLPAGATLRVLTRGRRAGEAASALRWYLGKTDPVWHNVGDIVSVTNELSQTVASNAYGGAAGPQPPLVFGQTAVFTKVIKLNATDGWTAVVDVQDGDTLSIQTNEQAIATNWTQQGKLIEGTIGVKPFGEEFLPSGRRLLGGRKLGDPQTDTGSGFQLAGAPRGALLGGIYTRGTGTDGIGETVLVGAGKNLELALDRGATCWIVVNEDSRWDDRGHFMVTVTLFR